jgi:hypothetical protein
MTFKFLKCASVGLILAVSNLANATLLTWDLSDPAKSGFVTFVYNDDTLDGITDNSDLVSITADFGAGTFTYLFNSPSLPAGSGRLLYDDVDLSLIRYLDEWDAIESVNSFNGYTLVYQHYNQVYAEFILTKPFTEIVNLRIWSHIVDANSGLLDLNVENTTIAAPAPPMFAILVLGFLGLASRRFKNHA